MKNAYEKGVINHKRNGRYRQVPSVQTESLRNTSLPNGVQARGKHNSCIKNNTKV